MASIEKHISDLLYLHDCVIVPGLGGFVANHSPAVVLDERHLFMPPSKEIGFNRSLLHNDGLLVNHLCRREGCSYQDGMEQVNAFVSELLSSMGRKEVVTLEGIGDFRKDDLGNMLFAPLGGSAFLTDSFGLGQFQFEPLESASSVGQTEEPVRRLLKSRSPRYWASIAAMMAGLFFFTSELKMPEQTQMNQGSFFSISKDTPAPEADDAYYLGAESVSDEGIEMKSGVSAEPESPAQSPLKDDATVYHLIAASFAQSGPAQKVLGQMQAKGYTEARVIQSGNGRFRVALCSFANKSEAMAQLYQVREMPKFSEVWLWRH
jgi:hypothetical protein